MPVYRLDKGHSKNSLPFDIRTKFCSEASSMKTKKNPALKSELPPLHSHTAVTKSVLIQGCQCHC